MLTGSGQVITEVSCEELLECWAVVKGFPAALVDCQSSFPGLDVHSTGLRRGKR